MRLDADLLRRPSLLRLIDVLSDDGAAPRLVGGCIRDGLLGRPVSDVDLATPMVPLEVMAKLKEADIKAVPTGIDHGTVTAIVDGTGYEITTLRRDVATDGRRAVVAFTDDWRADAARRDFTMNAMSADPDGTVHDYFGGIADARAGIVRFVGDPTARIREDYLRVLRFFRFQAWYGGPIPPSPAVMQALAASVWGLDRLAGERVRQELLKWLGAPDPRVSWNLAVKCGAAEWLFGNADGARLDDLVAREICLGVAVAPLRRLAAMTVPPGPGFDEVSGRYRLSKAETRYLAAMEAAVASARLVASDAAALQIAYYRGVDIARDAILLAASDKHFSVINLKLLTESKIPVFPVSGTDAERRGLSRGPKIGGALKSVESWWVSQNFKPDRSACLQRLAMLAERGNSTDCE